MAYELGWSAVTNGELILLVEQEGYELLITTDTNLGYQQNLAARRISIPVLTATSLPRIRRVTSEIQCAVTLIREGDYQEPRVPLNHLWPAPGRGAMLLP